MLTNVARRDENIPQPCLMGHSGTVGDIFQIGEWLGIGIGDAWTAVLLTEVDNLLRSDLVVSHIDGGDLRDVVVLTVQTTKVATRTGKGKTCGAGMEMIERFLFDRVDGQRTRTSIDLTDQYTVVIPATATNPRLTIGNTTMMRTEQTLHPSIV